MSFLTYFSGKGFHVFKNRKKNAIKLTVTPTKTTAPFICIVKKFNLVTRQDSD